MSGPPPPYPGDKGQGQFIIIYHGNASFYLVS